MATWQVQQAKARFTEVLEEANSSGPQIITRHGAERAVVPSIDDYRALMKYKPDIKAVLLGGPKFDDFEIVREPDCGREIDL